MTSKFSGVSGVSKVVSEASKVCRVSRAFRDSRVSRVLMKRGLDGPHPLQKKKQTPTLFMQGTISPKP